MTFITQTAGYWFLGLFGLVMVLITCIFARWKQYKTHEGFLVASRKVGWFLGGTSIAASWIWAPALFVSVQFAYEKGLPGIFWFIVPNILALALFYFLGPRIRKLMPEGYTLPQYIKYRLKSDKLHKVYLFPYFFYQLMAVTVQLFAGGSLVSLLTGISLTTVMPILLVIALAYTLISGLEASIVTDFVQMILIFSIGAVILPFTWIKAGGTTAIAQGLGGINNLTNIFDPGIAFSFGIVTAIGLIAGAISDQQYWQRTFALKKGHIKSAFIFGALLFGIVPIALSTLGFLAANANLNIILPEGVDASMIGVQTVATLLPSWAVFLFVIMLLAGLCSTLDSGLSAASSLWATDVIKYSKDEKRILEKERKGEKLTEEDRKIHKRLNNHVIKQSRLAMVGISLLGLLVALAVNYIPQFGLFHLWWVFNTIAATVVVPTVLSLYWKRLSAKGVLWGVITAFVIGLPLFIYSNLINNPMWIVGSTLFIIGVSTFFCFIFRKKKLVEKSIF